VAVVFAVAVVVLMGDVLLGDRVLLTCNPSLWQPWRSYATEEQLSEKNYRTDSARTYLPRRVELTRRVASGELPLWNPYVFGGSPFLADPQARVAYPISLMLTVFDPVRALGYDIAIHLFIALVGMYLFLKKTGSTTLGAMAGSFAYGFSSFFATRMGHPTFFGAASWIPLFFYAFERARTNERSGTIMLAACLALGYLAGFPQVFLFGVLGLGIYALLLGLDDVRVSGRRMWSRNLRNLKILGISGGLSLLLVGIQLVPFWELVRNSVGLGIDLEQMTQLFVSKPLLMIRSLVPGFFGNPVEGTRWLSLLDVKIHPYNPGFLVYCGIGALLTGLGGVAFMRTSGRIRALFVLLLLSVGIASSGLVFKIAAGVVPLLRYSQVDRIAVMACFSLAALVGTTLTLVSRTDNAKAQSLFRCIVIGLVVLIIAGSIAFQLKGDDLISGLLPKAGYATGNSLQGLASARLSEWAGTGGSEWLAYERGQVLRALVFALLTGLLVVGFVSRKRAPARLRRLAGTAFIVILIIDVGLMVRSYYVTQPHGSIGETEGVALLRHLAGDKGRWRVVTTDSEEGALPPNTNQIFGIHSLQGLATIVPQGFTDLMRWARLRSMQDGRGALSGGVRYGSMSEFMCVRYVLGHDADEPLLNSPVMRAVAQERSDFSAIRQVTIGGRSKLAFVQSADDEIEVDLLLPDVARLDFEFGVLSRHAAQDSIKVELVCVNGTRRVEFMQVLDQSVDGDKWHWGRLDISDLGGGYARLSLRTATSSGQPEVQHGPVLAWAGLDLTIGDCTLRPIESGYEIDFASQGQVMRVEVESARKEVTLDVDLGNGVILSRLVTFSELMRSRTLMFRTPERGPGRITVRSGAPFTITQATLVHPNPLASLDYDLIYNGDMRIYENVAALKKGICLDKALLAPGSGDTGIVRIAGHEHLAAARCGEVEIVSYRPETVVLEVSSDRDCIVLFQDLDYPGWTATVDGRNQDMLRTDVGVRAIQLGSGKHRVVMEYKPMSFRVGLVLTCLGILLTVLYAKKAKSEEAT
jgi:hypothetical protein